MKRYGALGLTVWALLVVGCGGGDDEIHEAAIDQDVEDRTPYEELYTTADTAQSYETEGAAPVAPVQGPQGPADVTVGGPLTATGNLRGIAEDAPPGSVTVTEYGPGTQVSVKIDRYTPGTTLVASLVRGECERPGQVVTRVGEPFTVGPSGFATMTADIQVPTRTILDGDHSIRINTPGRGAPEIVLACAVLPPVSG